MASHRRLLVISNELPDKILQLHPNCTAKSAPGHASDSVNVPLSSLWRLQCGSEMEVWRLKVVSSIIDSQICVASAFSSISFILVLQPHPPDCYVLWSSAEPSKVLQQTG